MVRRADSHYVEVPGVMGGPLTATVCSKHAHHHPRQLTKKERMDLLCDVIGHDTGLAVFQRSHFMTRHRLGPRSMDTRAIQLAFSARRDDVKFCCTKTDHHRTVCLEDARRRRVDNFCEDGSPDIPFTALRGAFMRQREEACCWKLGESRYSCFALHAHRKHQHVHSSADFSLDETDPLNDMLDYAEELQLLEQELGRALFASDSAKLPGHSSTPLPTIKAITTTTTSTTTTTPTTTTAPTTASPRHRPPAASGDRRQGRRGAQVGVRGREREGAGPPRSQGAGTATSREIHDKQGGRSTDKTLAKLKRRMWKLSLKTECCRGGVQAAATIYGDFHSVWAQCRHSTHKYMETQDLREGQVVCADQFRRCCMEKAISTPSEVVTWAPDTASSREWDRDRHLVNTVYLPPHARTRHAHVTSAQTPSAPEQTVGADRVNPQPQPVHKGTEEDSSQARGPVFVEEGDSEKIFSSRRQRQSRKHSSREPGRTRQSTKVQRERLDRRRHRKLRKPHSQVRGGAGRRGRRFRESGETGWYRAAMRFIDDPEVDEEPTLKKKQKRRNDGDRGQRKTLTKQIRGRPPPQRHPQPLSEEVSDPVTKKTLLKNDRDPPGTTAVSDSRTGEGDGKTETTKNSRRGRIYRKLSTETAENTDAEISEENDEESDDGSEENLDSLGLSKVDTGDDDEDDDELEDDDDFSEDSTDQDITDDENEVSDDEDDITTKDNLPKAEQKNKNRDTDKADPAPLPGTSRQKAIQPADPSQPGRERHSLQSFPISTSSTPREQRRGSSPSKEGLASAAKRGSPPSKEARRSSTSHDRRSSASSDERRNQGRLRLRGDLNEDGHTRNAGSKRRKKPRNRKRTRTLRHPRRMRGRHGWRDLSEALEED